MGRLLRLGFKSREGGGATAWRGSSRGGGGAGIRTPEGGGGGGVTLVAGGATGTACGTETGAAAHPGVDPVGGSDVGT